MTNNHTREVTPENRVITRDEMTARFRPLHGLFSDVIDNARAQTTLERFRRLHPEVAREAGLKRIAGQERWILVADGLVDGISDHDGFWVASTESEHNSGRYIFRFEGGLLTVRKEPHDEADPEDGKYIQEAMNLIKQQAPLAPGIDPDEPIVVYLSVTARAAMLKIKHPTLDAVMKIQIADLAPVTEALAPRGATPRTRTKARSTRVKRVAPDAVDGDAADSKP